MVAHQAGRFGAQGDAQHGSYMMRGTTTGAAQTELALDGGTPAATTRIVLPNNSTYSFTGQLAARSSTGDSAGWRFTGTLKRGASGASTTLLGVTTTDTQSETGSSAWTIAVTADTTNGNLSLKVTGAAATAIRWVATVETAELTY